MDGFVLIVACLGLGMLLARTRGMPETLAASLAAYAVRVALPALVLQRLHAIAFDPSVLLPALAPVVVFLVVALATLLLARVLALGPATVGCLILVCGSGNTSIVGVPVVAALLGDAAVGFALVADQANFIVLSIAGLTVANLYAARRDPPAVILRRIVTYPPVIAMTLALATRPFAYPPALEHLLAALAATLSPVAIVSVGAGLRLRQTGPRLRDFALGLGLKLVLAPAAILALYTLLPHAGGDAFAVSVLQAGMPPMIVAALIAVERDLDPQLALLLSGFGIPISLVTASLWSLAC
ncbi:MAG: AEC family transporter [Hyphomicrobiaceae bacterium]|nr:AEC family transporter [Hyphomicrobiaceae bacterium]